MTAPMADRAKTAGPGLIGNGGVGGGAGRRGRRSRRRWRAAVRPTRAARALAGAPTAPSRRRIAQFRAEMGDSVSARAANRT